MTISVGYDPNEVPDGNPKDIHPWYPRVGSPPAAVETREAREARVFRLRSAPTDEAMAAEVATWTPAQRREMAVGLRRAMPEAFEHMPTWERWLRALEA